MAVYFDLPTRTPIAGRDYEFAVIANSEALNLGDAIVAGTTTSVNQFVKGAKNSAGSNKILGVVQGFRPISTSSTNLTAEQSSFTAVSNNQTTVQFGVLYEPARFQNRWLATLDANTGTTTGSAGVGMFNMSSGVNGLTEASFVLDNSGQTGSIASVPYQFTSIGVATNYGINYTSAQVFGFFSMYV